MDKIRSLGLFMSVVESGSFAAAAKKHATDPSTVSKAIKRLEQQLGLQLFHRSTRKLSLTTAGEKYAKTVGSLYQQIEHAEEDIKAENNSASGKLKINLPISYGRNYVMPMLCEFSKRYPDIHLDISFNDEYVDMIDKAIDVSIRSGTLSDSRLVAQKLTPMEFIICASKALIANRDIKVTKQSLSRFPWLQFRFKQTGKIMPIHFNFQGKALQVSPQKTTIVDDGESMMELCSAGLGLTLMPHFTAKKFVLNGNVDVIAKVDDFANSGIFIVYPKRENLPKRTQLLINFIKDSLKNMGESPENTWLTKIVLANGLPNNNNT